MAWNPATIQRLIARLQDSAPTANTRDALKPIAALYFTFASSRSTMRASLNILACPLSAVLDTPQRLKKNVE
jgi:hypothetical protein